MPATGLPDDCHGPSWGSYHDQDRGIAVIPTGQTMGLPGLANKNTGCLFKREFQTSNGSFFSINVSHTIFETYSCFTKK